MKVSLPEVGVWKNPREGIFLVKSSLSSTMDICNETPEFYCPEDIVTEDLGVLALNFYHNSYH